VGMVDEDNFESLKPLIDGGTEGMFRQRRWLGSLSAWLIAPVRF
jgi:hypothetical protein